MGQSQSQDKIEHDDTFIWLRVTGVNSHTTCCNTRRSKICSNNAKPGIARLAISFAKPCLKCNLHRILQFLHIVNRECAMSSEPAFPQKNNSRKKPLRFFVRVRLFRSGATSKIPAGQGSNKKKKKKNLRAC